MRWSHIFQTTVLGVDGEEEVRPFKDLKQDNGVITQLP
jgi:hypothetical protein